MAVVGIHRTIAVLPELWVAMLKCCDFVQFVAWQDEEIVVFRVQGEELPKEDVMCVLHVSVFDGILPFINHIEIFEHVWQPLKH